MGTTEKGVFVMCVPALNSIFHITSLNSKIVPKWQKYLKLMAVIPAAWLVCHFRQNNQTHIISTGIAFSCRYFHWLAPCIDWTQCDIGTACGFEVLLQRCFFKWGIWLKIYRAAKLLLNAHSQSRNSFLRVVWSMVKNTFRYVKMRVQFSSLFLCPRTFLFTYTRAFCGQIFPRIFKPNKKFGV